MKSAIVFYLLVLMLLFSTSCSYFKRNKDRKVIFTVKSTSLNIRKSHSTKSEIIGRLVAGDTIIPDHKISPLSKWVRFEYNNGKGWVVTRYLTSHSIPDIGKVSNMKLGKFQM